jgi:hypothetical protein
LWVPAAALLISAGLALRLGIPDLLLPLSVSSQLTGLAFSLAGTAGLAGLAGLPGIPRPLLARTRPWPERREAARGFAGRIA